MWKARWYLLFYWLGLVLLTPEFLDLGDPVLLPAVFDLAVRVSTLHPGQAFNDLQAGGLGFFDLEGFLEVFHGELDKQALLPVKNVDAISELYELKHGFFLSNFYLALNGTGFS